MLNNINKLNLSLSFAGHSVADFYNGFAIGLIPLLAYKLKLSSYEVSLIAFLSIVPSSIQFIFGYPLDIELNKVQNGKVEDTYLKSKYFLEKFL